MADEGYRVFVVRVHREGPAERAQWRGVIELVGTEERSAVGGVPDIADFIERHLVAGRPNASPPARSS